MWWIRRQWYSGRDYIMAKFHPLNIPYPAAAPASYYVTLVTDCRAR